MVNNGILPIILAVMDQQLSAETLLKYPLTYQVQSIYSTVY
jgi:hypothetical protein